MKNRFFNPDKYLADRGWSDLRSTLDREMPERRKRRRFLWLWWLLPALLAGGAATYWQVHKAGAIYPAGPATPVTKPAGPVAASPGPAANGDQLSLASIRNFTEKNPARQPGSAGKIGRAKMNASPNYVVSAAQPARHLEAASPLAEQPAIFTENNGLQAIANNTTAAYDLPSVLSTLPVGPFFVNNRQPGLTAIATPEPSHITPHHPPSRWDFGLTAGVHSNDFSKLHGGTLGFMTDFNFSRRWGLRSGLAYGYEKLPLASRAIINAPAVYDTVVNDGFVVVEDVLVGPATSNTNAVPAEVQTRVSAIHRLEMPLMLWWQPLPHWRLYGGGALARTLQVETGRRNAAINDPQLYENQIIDPNNRLSQLANQSVRHWQTSLLGGIGFKLSRRFEFDFQTQYLPAGITLKGASTQLGLNGAYDPSQSYVGGQEPLWRFHFNATLFF